GMKAHIKIIRGVLKHMIDIYFEQDYGKLYEKHEKGKSESFDFKSVYGDIKHIFIKREISTLIDGELYYDIITPYGYGGPIILDYKEGCRDLLIKEYRENFQKYCDNHNIVSEFVRFHPIENNVYDFNHIYSTTHIRNTVGTNLEDFDNPFQEEFSKSCRKNI